MIRPDERTASRRNLRLGLAALVLATAACAHNPDRLPRVDRQFYYNLESEVDALVDAVAQAGR